MMDIFDYDNWFDYNEYFTLYSMSNQVVDN